MDIKTIISTWLILAIISQVFILIRGLAQCAKQVWLETPRYQMAGRIFLTNSLINLVYPCVEPGQEYQVCF